MVFKIILSLVVSGILFAAAACITPLPTASPSGGTQAPVSPTLTATFVAPALASPTRAPSTQPTAAPAATRIRLTPTPAPIDSAELGALERDIIYCVTNDIPLKLDLYYPKPSNGKAFPVALNIHGGSWSFGDKQASDSAPDIPVLVQRGYVVAAVNYRLAPAHKFPAQLEDVKCAVRFLRAHAALYHLDSKRIGAWGCSAGGHLAALLGVTQPGDGFDQGEYLDQSSRVQAVAAITAPMDIDLYDAMKRAEMLKRVFGTARAHSPIFTIASPVNYVAAGASPFLIFQGDQDNLIVRQHGEAMRARLTAAGAPAELVTVREGRHCLPSQAAMNPSRAEISKMIADFFDQKLK